MTKTQKVIVLAAAIIILFAILFPPYYISILNFNQFVNGQRLSGWKWIGMIRGSEKIRFDMLRLEIFGVVVLAGAALLITKKAK